MLEYYNNNNNNIHICIAPYGRNFRGANMLYATCYIYARYITLYYIVGQLNYVTWRQVYL